MQASPVRPIAVITGASSGLGVDFAREAARDGCDLVLVARTEAPMQALAQDLEAKFGAASHVIAHDLALPGAGAAAAKAIGDLGLQPDILINNAGFGYNGDFVELDAEQTTRMMQLNMVTLTDLTRALLPGMLARRKGRIMLLASTAAFQPGPSMAVYCATKAYVLSFGEALAFEVRGTGVTVTTVCPGATKTNFQKNASIDEAASLLMKTGMMTSAAVARQGYRAMKSGTSVVVTGIPNLVSAMVARHLPHAVVVPMAAKILGK